MKPLKREFIVCDCGDIEHQLSFCYDEEEFEEGWDMMYTQIHLQKLSVWKRLVYGIKYIFGYQSKYGAFTEFYISPNDVDKMIATLTAYRNRKPNVSD